MERGIGHAAQDDSPESATTVGRHGDHVNLLMPHQALLDRVWVAEYGATEHCLRVFISRLRGKLQRPGGQRYIQTERGRGYRFVRPTKR